MKKIFISLCIMVMVVVSATGCKMSSSASEVTYSFEGVIKQVDSDSAIVTPNVGEEIRSSGDAVRIRNYDFSTGEKVKITYDGTVMESYPLQIIVISIEKEDGTKVDVERKIPTKTDDDSNDTVGITSDGKEFKVETVENESSDIPKNKVNDSDGMTAEDVHGNTEILVGDTNKPYTFVGKISKVFNGQYIVTPNNDEEIIKSGDAVYVNTDNKFSIGDIVKVTYTGDIMEMYPLQINTIRVEKVK